MAAKATTSAKPANATRTPRQTAARPAAAKRGAGRSNARQATQQVATAPTAQRKGAAAPAKRQARASLPPVVPIREKHTILNGAITVSPKGPEVLFMNASTRKSVVVSRNIASTVERAINVLVPTEGEASTAAANTASAAVTSGAQELADNLMKEGVVEGENVSLTPRRATVDSKHPDQFVAEGKGLPVVVFDIRIKGEEEVIGNLFALSPRKFTLVDVTGNLQSSKSSHLNVNQALIRIQVAVSEFLSRRSARPQGQAAVA